MDNPRAGGGHGGRREGQGDGKFIARGVRLVHEDDDVIVVEKPAGLVTADPSRAAEAKGGRSRMMPSAREGQTLFDVIKRHVKKHGGRKLPRRMREDLGMEDRPGRVWVIHRLDKEASGLLVFAKSERAFTGLKAQLASKSAHRVYAAVTEGVVGLAGSAHTRESMIDEDREPTAPRRTGRGRDGPRREPKLAVTHYTVTHVGNDRSLLNVRLETGRKNQIRVHMQEIGHPLVGDLRFGAVSDPIGRVALHAAELGFTHPETGREVRFASPAPAAFYRAVGMEPPTGSAETETAAGEQGGDGSGTARRSRPGPVEPGAPPAAETSWDEVAGWYDTMLEDRGNDHYERVILPGTLRLLGEVRGSRVLDVACGQGILCRRLAGMGAAVVGVDAAPRLIEAARQRSPEIEYHVGDARELGAFAAGRFDAVTCVMALSNIDPLGPALAGMAAALRPGGTLVAVISHPAFRVPGQSGWGWDDGKRRQYRRVDAYLGAFQRDISMHPGKAAQGKRGGEVTTPTFHRPLGQYVAALAAAGLLVTDLGEWVSERAATSGPRAREENRARTEIPLFLGIRAVRAATRA